MFAETQWARGGALEDCEQDGPAVWAVGEGEQLGREAMLASPHRTLRHPVMRPHVSTQWPTMTGCGRGTPAPPRVTGEGLGLFGGKSLNFKEGYKQTPDLSTHEPLIGPEPQQPPGLRTEGAGVGAGDVISHVSWLEEDMEIIGDSHL